MKEQITRALDAIPNSIKEYAHTMLVGAGIGALTAGTAKIFQKLNMPHPAEPAKPHYDPGQTKQTPRWQPRHDYQPRRNWSHYHQNRQTTYHRGNGHGRG